MLYRRIASFGEGGMESLFGAEPARSRGPPEGLQQALFPYLEVL